MRNHLVLTGGYETGNVTPMRKASGVLTGEPMIISHSHLIAMRYAERVLSEAFNSDARHT
jgi:hypothetical protein